MKGIETTTLTQPGSFEPEAHFYPQVLNAHIHPLVGYFFSLGNDRIAQRYCHLHPEVEPTAVHKILSARLAHFGWGGADLFHVTTERGARHIVVVETNSCPSGQKSMPLIDEQQEQAGYRRLVESAFVPMLKRRGLPKGGLAVLYDKNPMEATGYAAVIADVTNEPVHLVYLPNGGDDPPAWFSPGGVLHARGPDGDVIPIRAALRYVTQRPWARIPPITKTAILNPVLVCLAGGRNKMLAAKAYDFFNAEFYNTGLRIRTPETIRDVAKAEVPLWVKRMGGIAVVKVPYSNAGQGVFTITSEPELEAFMAGDYNYDSFIVQTLVGNNSWSSRSVGGTRYYHVGTVPNRKGQFYAADFRFMVGNGPAGFFPVSVYARRARQPMAEVLNGQDSWDMLGTNLSVKVDGAWSTESNRLVLMDSRDFNKLGIGLDDITEAYIQSVLSMTAIDRMAVSLLTKSGKFRRRFFSSLNPDPALMAEIVK